MKKYNNKYRIPSTRLSSWDYGAAALYFVTICTHNRECWFGKIMDGKMSLSEIGIIAKSEWLKTFEIRPDMNLWMGEFVVMPNHVHGIIGIGDNRFNTECRDAMHCVSTMHRVSTNGNPPKNQFGPQSKNLGSIMRGFKSSVTISARLIHPEFKWQTRFHDQIIRNDSSFQRISKYIIENPSKWKEDKFYE